MAVNSVYSIPTFRGQASEYCQCNHSVCPTCGKPINNTDTYTQEKPKKGFLSKLKDKFIGFRKTCIDIGYMTCGAVKGAAVGAASGAGVLGIAALRNIIKKAPKNITTGNKVLAGAVAIAVMAGNIISSKLNANETKSNLDHRWETGHNG